MAIVDTVSTVMKEEGITQKQFSNDMHMDQSYLSRILKGERKWPEHLDASASKVNWKITLEIIEERTGGWVKNRFGDLDPHPAALQLQLEKEMREASEALGAIILSNNVDWSKRIEDLEKSEKEISDVVGVGLVMKGAVQDMIKKAKEGGK